MRPADIPEFGPVSGEPSVTLTRSFRTDPATLFRTFTEPELLERWLAPRDGMETHASLDLRVGGAWRVQMGSRAAHGTYREIEPPRRLVFTWIWEDDEDGRETLVTVRLQAEGASTSLVLTHERLPLEVDCMGFEAGWNANLTRLARLVAEIWGAATSRRALGLTAAGTRRKETVMPRVVHFEVKARDVERASSFYREAFDWDAQEWEGPTPYRFLITGSDGEAGIDGAVATDDGSGQSIVLTLEVPAVEEAERRVASAGGKVTRSNEPIPGVGRLAYVEDSEGNTFGILEREQ